MGKKKFIEKKKSATFQLLARDTSDPNYTDDPSGDRVFVRVDNNQYDLSIFEDAPEDCEEGDDSYLPQGLTGKTSTYGKSSLPDVVRKEILELGFPDDGYNYLLHMREIKKSGGGSAYYENSKAKLDQVPLDVKAYDASRVKVSELVNDSSENPNLIYNVASKTVCVRIQRAVDEEVAALLDADEDDLLRFGSDVEEFEEDFVIKANLPEEGEEDEIVNDKINQQLEVLNSENSESDHLDPEEGEVVAPDDLRLNQTEEEPRARRLLDEQFDMLTLQEYGTDSESEYNGSISEEDVPLAVKLNQSLRNREIDDLEIDDGYKVPADFVHGNEALNDEKLVNSAADLIRRCVEYGEKYNETQDNEDFVLVEESSDESDHFDCETIVSTYSNLENHPAKIEAPASRRRKKMMESIPELPRNDGNVISLRGREKLPVDFLPNSRKNVVEKVTKVSGLKVEHLKRKTHGEESKDEKKERKAAVKEERREARRSKKELKGIYKSETHRAQKVAATNGPSSIHLL